jgi:hypothetical protein
VLQQRSNVPHIIYLPLSLLLLFLLLTSSVAGLEAGADIIVSPTTGDLRSYSTWYFGYHFLTIILIVMISADFSVDICLVAYSKQHYSVSRCCSFPWTFIHLSFWFTSWTYKQSTLLHALRFLQLCITCNSRKFSVFVGVDTAWSPTVVEEAESLGLVVACITGICIVSAKPLFIARGWLGAKDGLDVLAQGSGQAEVFERVTTSRNNSTYLPLYCLWYWGNI